MALMMFSACLRGVSGKHHREANRGRIEAERGIVLDGICVLRRSGKVKTCENCALYVRGECNIENCEYVVMKGRLCPVSKIMKDTEQYCSDRCNSYNQKQCKNAQLLKSWF